MKGVFIKASFPLHLSKLSSLLLLQFSIVIRIFRILLDLNLLEDRIRRVDLLDLWLVLGRFSSFLGFFRLLLLLDHHPAHALLQLLLHVVILTVGLHEVLQVSSSLLILLLYPVGMSSPVQCLLVGVIELLKDEGSVIDHTRLLVQKMQTGAAIGVDLSDLSLNITLIQR